MLRHVGTGALGELLSELTDYQYPTNFSYLYYKGAGDLQYNSNCTTLLQVLTGEEFVWDLRKVHGCTSYGTVYESVWHHKLPTGIQIVSGRYVSKDPAWIESLKFQPIVFSELNRLRQGIRIRE